MRVAGLQVETPAAGGDESDDDEPMLSFTNDGAGDGGAVSPTAKEAEASACHMDPPSRHSSSRLIPGQSERSCLLQAVAQFAMISDSDEEDGGGGAGADEGEAAAAAKVAAETEAAVAAVKAEEEAAAAATSEEAKAKVESEEAAAKTAAVAVEEEKAATAAADEAKAEADAAASAKAEEEAAAAAAAAEANEEEAAAAKEKATAEQDAAAKADADVQAAAKAKDDTAKEEAAKEEAAKAEAAKEEAAKEEAAAAEKGAEKEKCQTEPPVAGVGMVRAESVTENAPIGFAAASKNFGRPEQQVSAWHSSPLHSPCLWGQWICLRLPLAAGCGLNRSWSLPTSRGAHTAGRRWCKESSLGPIDCWDLWVRTPC